LECTRIMKTSSPEKELYKNQQEGIRITPTLLEYKGIDYPIHNIDHWKEEKEPSESQLPINIMSIGGILLLTALALEQTTLVLPGLIFVLLLAFLSGGSDYTYKLIVTANKGEEISLKVRNADNLKKIKAALEKAMAQLEERR
jgi:Family of unknown function (DUF6232)